MELILASQKNYNFGLNTYDTIKRSMTQFFNKGIVYEKWGVKGYWVIQEYIYKNLTSRYGLSQNTYSSEYACRFALYDLVQSCDIITLESKDIISVSVDAIYQAMRNNPSLPEKEVFITILNKKLQTRIRLDLIYSYFQVNRPRGRGAMPCAPTTGVVQIHENCCKKIIGVFPLPCIGLRLVSPS